MDNLCHTLAGAALAGAGLDRRTPLAVPTLVIAANLPDIDVLAYFREPLFALTFRRGWTHGVLAMAVLPLLLAGAMLAWDRVVRLRRRPDAVPAQWGALLLLSVVGVLSHPLLDLLNTYGVRLLMPFSSRWFYGDTLFIVDPWLSGLLALAWLTGTVGSRRERAGRGGVGGRLAAQVVTAGAIVYIAAMYAAGRVAREAATHDAATLAPASERVMAAPVPVDPFRRAILLPQGESYRWASFDWRRTPRLAPRPDVIRMNFDAAEVRSALDHPDARAFLGWSRFPAAAVLPAGVRLYDLRYADAETDSWASVVIPDRASSARTFSSSKRAGPMEGVTTRPLPAPRPRYRRLRPRAGSPASRAAAGSGRSRCRSPV
jgi:inner membrane protein